MEIPPCYLAFDLGAESGRAFLGTMASGRLSLSEIARFPNRPVRVLDSLYWDVLGLWEALGQALACAAERTGGSLAGIAVDTWGVDFGLVDQYGDLLALPHCYRDSRTDDILSELSSLISEPELYRLTGIPYLPITTLCQLLAMRIRSSPLLGTTPTLLMMPSLFTYWLCGEQATEETIAGTTQLRDLWLRHWCQPLLERLDLPAEILPRIVPTGSVLGSLLPEMARENGLGAVPVIATAGHDTAAAAVAVPCGREEGGIFISCGTWSIIGTEIEQPILSDEALRKRFLNEAGAYGTLLFAHNSAGLWPLQECRRAWERMGQPWSYNDLVEKARRAPPFAAIVDPDAPAFAHPGEMPTKIADWCRATGQPAPEDPGSLTRSILEGLALRYRAAIEDLASLTGQPAHVIHLVGGGSRNPLLCQMTADATRIPVVAGPGEATAVGTILLQLLALGQLTSVAELRDIVRKSFELVVYEPIGSDRFDAAYETFRQLTVRA